MDGAGNLVMATDGCGAVWRYEYDSLHRLVKQTSPLGAVECYTYDGHDALTGYADAQEAKTCYEVDANGRVQRCTVLCGSECTLDKLSHVLGMAGESYNSFMKGAAAVIVRDGMILSETLLVPVDQIAHASAGNVHGFTESVAHVRQREEEWIADAAEKAQDMSAFYVGTCAGDALTLYILWGSMRNPSDMGGGGSYAQKAYVQTAEGVVVEVEVESNGTVVGVLSGVPSTDVSGTIRNMEKEHEKNFCCRYSGWKC